MPSSHDGLRLLLAGALAAVVGGCSGGAGEGPGEPLGQSSAATTFPNDMAAFDYFVGKGLPGFQAAGIVGNLDQESGVDPTAVQGGGPGRGIAQWSVGGRWDTDANDNAVWYAGQQAQPVLSLQLQLDFIWYELTSFSGYGLAALQATTNVTDATVAFETDFEGCGQCDQATRIAYAQGVLSAYGAIPYAAQFVSQSFPLATTTLTMTAGQVIPSYIELKNVGTKTWDSSTHLGTTQPRDRTSAFADATWLAPDRPSGVTGTVAPGSSYKFTFDLAAPMTVGSYDEFFGVLEEGVAWFGDPGQGGPPDNDLEVKITVVASEGGAPVDAAPGDGASPADGATSAADAGEADGRSGEGDGGVLPMGEAPDGGGPRATPGRVPSGGGGGCSVGPLSYGGDRPWGASGLTMMLVMAGMVRRVRRGRSCPPR